MEGRNIAPDDMHIYKYEDVCIYGYPSFVLWMYATDYLYVSKKFLWAPNKTHDFRHPPYVVVSPSLMEAAI